jgi:rare lipoprotein A
MNQPRWTCLTALVLSTVTAPMATGVQAKTLPSPVEGREYYLPVSPQSLPTVTPTTVTAPKTDPAPTVGKTVSPVSTLPIVPSQIRSKNSLPVTSVRVATASFHPDLRATAPILTIQTQDEPAVMPVNAVAPLPQVTDRVADRTETLPAFVGTATSAPLRIVGTPAQPFKGKVPTNIIANSVTAQAEVLPMQPVANASFGKTKQNQTAKIATTDRAEEIPEPKVAPIVSNPTERTEIPSFQAGVPIFVFEDDRPKQIVNTAIAQIGDTIVAPEPSIAIPVDRPKQSAMPDRSAVPAPAATQPLDPTIANTTAPTETTQPALDKIVATQIGQASWYGSEGGPKTANGERYNPNGLTAAHRTLPFGTMVRVTSLKTGKFVVVRINDRGPFSGQRIVDLSAGAAEAIGLKSDGVGRVRMDILATRG